MPTIVRRLDSRQIEVLFGVPVGEDTDRGRSLLELAERQEAYLTKTPAGITGVVADQKAYINHLHAVNATKDEIRNIRAALDDSKKARRQRMRG